MGYVDQVSERAAEVRILRVLLSLIALPFFVLGMVVGVLWLAVRWSYAAVEVGFAQAAQSRQGGNNDAS